MTAPTGVAVGFGTTTKKQTGLSDKKARTREEKKKEAENSMKKKNETITCSVSVPFLSGKPSGRRPGSRLFYCWSTWTFPFFKETTENIGERTEVLMAEV